MKGQEFLTTEKGYLNIPESEFKLTMKELSELLDEFAVKLFSMHFVSNCLDKEHMRVIFEQSRATKENFEDWHKFNYPNGC